MTFLKDHLPLKEFLTLQPDIVQIICMIMINLKSEPEFTHVKSSVGKLLFVWQAQLKISIKFFQGNSFTRPDF